MNKYDISEFVLNQIDGVVAIDKETACILYADTFFEKIYNENIVGKNAEQVFSWFSKYPQFSKSDVTVEWESIDAPNNKYYKIVSAQKETEDGEVIFHQLTDITEYMNLNHDVTKYMSFFKKLSGFQTAILKKLSSTYYELLPVLAEFFRTEELFLVHKQKASRKLVVYRRKDNKYYSMQLSDSEEMIKDIEINENKNLFAVCKGGISDQQYALYISESEELDTEILKEENLLSVIRLYLENGMMREKLIYDSEHDGLTGMYNKGKYFEMLGEVYNELDSVGILNFDVNNLKKINDTYGHEAGDRLIVKAADSIRTVLGDDIHGFRMGGDEFLVVACNISRAEFDKIKYKWETELKQLNVLDNEIDCVIAVGAAYGVKPYDFSTLLKEADERMYEDKKWKKKPGEEIR